MKMVMIAACTALLLAGCASGPLSGMGSTTSSVTQSLKTADEKALFAAETLYVAVLRTVNAAVDDGTLRGTNATKAAALLRTASAALEAAHRAKAVGDSVQMMASITGVTSAISGVRALIGK